MPSIEKQKSKKRSPFSELPWWVPLGTAAAAFAVFWPVLNNGFVWDDQLLLTDNFAFRGLDMAHLRWMFSAESLRFGNYHPLSWMSFAADFLLYGMNPRGFHLTNLLVHSINAALFCLLAGLLLDHAAPEGGKGKAVGAVTAALVFALHPLRVETVSWAIERRGLLSAFFMLLSLIGYLLSCGERREGRKGEGWLGMALASYLLSLLSKATGAPLPAVLMLLDYYPLRRLGKAPAYPAGEARRVWAEKAAFAAVALAFGLLALLGQWRAGTMPPLSGYGLFPRLGQAAFGSLFYAWKTLVPIHLSPLYDFTSLPGKGWLLGAVVLSAALTLYAASGRRPAWTALWGAYLAFLAPVSGLWQAGPHYAADRYTYATCWSWALAAGALVLWVRRRFPRSRALSLAGAGACLAVLSLLSRRQIAAWRDPASLARRIVQEQPLSAIAHNNLCSALRDEGRLAEAQEQCLQALALRPQYPTALANLANTLVDQGKIEEALARYNASLSGDPGNASVLMALGRALDQAGRLDESIAEYREAIRVKPDDDGAYNDLGVELLKKGRLDEAQRSLDTALSLDPANYLAHYNLGNIASLKRKPDEARREYEIALKINPGCAEARANWGLLLLGVGKPVEAERQLREALRLNPRYAEAENYLGVSLFMQGRSAEALEHFRGALSLRPDYADARFNLARAEALRRKRR